MSLNLEQIATNIEARENGIYFSKNSSVVSYPEIGNEQCLKIEQDSFWFDHRNNVIIEAVKKFSPQNTFFDVGGGNGFVSLGLQNNGISVVVVEPGVQGAVNARNRKIENVICSTVENAGFKKNSLESVGLFDVVEHIEDDEKILKSINEYLVDDGFIYITVPSYNFLWSNEDKGAGHFRRYTNTNLIKLLNRCGFKIVYSTYIFSILPIPIFFFRTIPSKLGMNKNANELEKNKKEHGNEKGLLSSLMQKIWNWELKKVKNSEPINFGGSCFVVAKKIS